MSRITKTKFNTKKNIRSSQSATERGQISRCEYWEEVKNIDPNNLVFLDKMGIILGLKRTYARSIGGSKFYDLKPFYLGQESQLSEQ